MCSISGHISFEDETLTSTTPVKHEIRIQSGVEPLNVKAYRLPEAQIQEVRKEVEELKRGGFIR